MNKKYTFLHAEKENRMPFFDFVTEIEDDPVFLPKNLREYDDLELKTPEWLIMEEEILT